MLQRRVYTNGLRVGLGVDETGMTIAGIAADAGTPARVLLIDFDPEWHMKGLQTCTLKIVGQVLNALLVTDGWIFVGCTRVGFSWIFAAVSVDLVKMFGFGVVRFELVVADGPGWRRAAVMLEFAKVFLAQAKQGRAVKLCIAAHEVVCVRMQRATPGVVP